MSQAPKFFPVDEDLVHSIELWSRNRIINGPDPKNGARTASELEGDLVPLSRPVALAAQKPFAVLPMS